MAAPRDATALHVVGDQSDPSWSVSDDPATGALIARLPSYITEGIAAATTAEIAKRIVAKGQRVVVVVDLHDVEEQDPVAPLIAMKGVMAVVSLIDRVDIIVRRQSIRAAAVTATQIMRLSYTVRSER